MSLQTVCPKVKFRPPFQRRQNPKTASLVAPRTERNLFLYKAQEGSKNIPVECFCVGNPRRGFPGARWRTTNRGFYLGVENSRILPTSTARAGVHRIAQKARFYLYFFNPVSAVHNLYRYMFHAHGRAKYYFYFDPCLHAFAVHRHALTFLYVFDDVFDQSFKLFVAVDAVCHRVNRMFDGGMGFAVKIFADFF